MTDNLLLAISANVFHDLGLHQVNVEFGYVIYLRIWRSEFKSPLGRKNLLFVSSISNRGGLEVELWTDNSLPSASVVIKYKLDLFHTLFEVTAFIATLASSGLQAE